ncbi:hypothetical protein ACSQ6I_07110 [Anabaena sp. WFMT]|uniref:hypothetical protein n=1 Tax=Anabaena sp. WFMT TaxID=3449730 RepID=UPI003F1FA1DE
MFNLTEQFKTKINDWGLMFHESQEGFYLYTNLDNDNQAYKFFRSENEAVQFMKDGLFFYRDGLWDKYINKPKAHCEI